MGTMVVVVVGGKQIGSMVVIETATFGEGGDKI